MLLDELFGCLKQDKKVKSDNSKIYKIHKYWARKPWNIVSSYISEYSEEGDLVLDPFCGSGVTGLEALVLGRDFYGIDLNPMSIKITEGTFWSDVDITRLKDDFNAVKERCGKKISDLYKIREKCPRCHGNLHTVHVICSGDLKGKARVYCPVCGWKTTEYYDVGLDVLKYNGEMPYWYPTCEMPKNFFKDRFSYKGVSRVSDFFSPRNLYALSLLLYTIKDIKSKYEPLLLLAFTNTILHASKLKGENVRPMSVNSYWIPNDYIDENVWYRFADRFNNLLAGKEVLLKRIKNHSLGKYSLINDSALNAKIYPQADYIFTDPPYGEAIQYSELSFLWNAWMGLDYDIKDEIIINPMQNKGSEEYSRLLNNSLDNIYSSLKEGGYFTLCFANKQFNVWRDVILHCKEIGFTLDNIKIYDTYGCPYNKNWSKFSPKTDLYLTFKKEKKKLYAYTSESVAVDTVIDGIIEYMHCNGIEMDTVKLYDVTISVIIWNIFYNNYDTDVKDLDIKSFCKIVEEKLG